MKTMWYKIENKNKEIKMIYRKNHMEVLELKSTVTEMKN